VNTNTADVVICGAGICGISAAYHLAAERNVKRVVLVDPREPMTFTSSKSTECYRNWWPGPDDTMVRFMNRSIELLEQLARQSNNYFALNRRGYVFLTADHQRAAEYQTAARRICERGAGSLRIHRGQENEPPYTPSPPEGFEGLPDGADLVLSPEIIRRTFPFVTGKAVAMLHVRRAGWLSAQQLGMYLLRQATAHGTELVQGTVVAVTTEKNRVRTVHIQTTQGLEAIQTENFVIASGPFLQQTADLIGVKLPVFNELHAKAVIKDPLGVIPRDVPLMIWDDPAHLFWEAHERGELEKDEEARWLLEKFPAGVHFRPEGHAGSPFLLALWTYDTHVQEPVAEPHFAPEYAEIVLRGLINMVPGLAVYAGKLQRPIIDGGYYCKTRENRPLIGPLPVEGAYIFGAVSGFGIMAAMSGGELLAQHVCGEELFDYAKAFTLSRYDDPQYAALILEMEASSGQL